MKLSPLHGGQIQIRWKPAEGHYRVFIPDRFYMDGEVKRQLCVDDDELHMALFKLAIIIGRYPQIV